MKALLEELRTHNPRSLRTAVYDLLIMILFGQMLLLSYNYIPGHSINYPDFFLFNFAFRLLVKRDVQTGPDIYRPDCKIQISNYFWFINIISQ